MKVDNLLKMIADDQREIEVQVTAEGYPTIEEKLDMILNTQHTILQVLCEVLKSAKKEGTIE